MFKKILVPLDGSALAEAINAAPGANVRATIVNVGSTSSPDYRLSLESTKLGGTAIQLNDGSQDLLDTLSTGTPATYKVNGQPSVPISSDSHSVTIAPGLTVTLLKAGSASVTVGRNAAAVSNALSSFVAAYNGAVDELDLHRGKGTGALRGNSLVYTLSAYLRELTGYSSGTDGISSLTSVGLSFDKNGKLSLDPAAFSSATSGQFAALTSFLGNSQGSGFLKFATGLMDSLEGATDGVIKTALSAVKDQMTDQDSRIAAARLRQAVARGLFGEARKILLEYCAEIGGEIRALPAGDSQVCELREESRRLFEWIYRITCAGRAHAGAQLAQLRASHPYHAPPAPRPSKWRLEG